MSRIISQTDRFRGCLLGLATGDAVGTTLEFKPPNTFSPLTDLVGGGPFWLQAGQWTDDTSMALCLAESLLTVNGFDPADQMVRYLRWFKEGHLSSTGRCFDIGVTVRDALHRFETIGNPLSGSTDPHSAGNGSIMRLAPVPMFYAADPQQAIEKSAESSKTTHATPAAVDACRYFGALIVGALQDVDKQTLLSPYFCPIPNYWQQSPLHPAIDEIAAGSFARKQPPEIKGSGYVVKSLEAALWAFYHSTTFTDGCLLAVNLGDDADTTGAVYGQIAGAYYGVQGIPSAWQEKLVMYEMILEWADKLTNHP